jgi:hypothetical protein
VETLDKGCEIKCDVIGNILENTLGTKRSQKSKTPHFLVVGSVVSLVAMDFCS